MIIETKYNIGDKVWLMYENMAISAKVIEMNIHIENSPHRGLRADCYCKIVCPYFQYEKYEDNLYPTKEELLNSL